MQGSNNIKGFPFQLSHASVMHLPYMLVEDVSIYICTSDSLYIGSKIILISSLCLSEVHMHFPFSPGKCDSTFQALASSNF